MIDRIEIADVTLSRGDRPLARGLSLTVSAGEAVAVTGANGAGKTTLLRAIAGLVRPDGGRIDFRLAGGPVEPEAARGRGLHLLGHLDGLKGHRTAREELVFATRWCGGTAHGLTTAVQALALSPLLDLACRRLSAGQRRRLALARLIAAPRPVWLLDEPLSPLDVRWRGVAADLMAGHLARGGMILAAVHDPLPAPLDPRVLDMDET